MLHAAQNKTIVSPSKIKAPSISVIPSISMEAEDIIQQKMKTNTTAHTDLRRKSADPSIHIYSNM